MNRGEAPVIVVTAADQVVEGNETAVFLVSGGPGGSATLTITDAPVQPPVVSGGSKTVAENALVPTDTITGTYSDPDGDPVTVNATGVFEGESFTAENGTWTWKFLRADGPNTRSITITAYNQGGSATATATATVVNVAPSLRLDEIPPIDEGGTVTLTGHITDPGADTFYVTVHWADGTTTGPLARGTLERFDLTHTYVDDNPSGSPWNLYRIQATVSDDDGGLDAKEMNARVNNVKPSDVTVTPANPIENGRAIVEAGAGGTSLVADGTFADVGVEDTFDDASTVAYGDFVVGPVTITGFANGVGTFDVPAHRYLAPGDYTAAVTIEDDDTGESAETPASKVPVTAARLDALTVADAANAANRVWSMDVGGGTYLHLGRKEEGSNSISLSADISAGNSTDLAAKHVRWRVRNGGLTIASGTFDPATPADRLVRLPQGVGEFVVEAGFNDNGDPSLGSGEVSRTVTVRIVTADLDVTNDGDVTDPEDGAATFSPGYRGDVQVLTATDDQPFKVVAENFAIGTTVGFEPPRPPIGAAVRS